MVVPVALNAPHSIFVPAPIALSKLDGEVGALVV
nr:MAG TPA: hypothetical protein [Caudoviricetes sp.]